MPTRAAVQRLCRVLISHATQASRELRTEQKDLGRVVQPQQQRCKGGGGAVGRRLRRMGQIEADEPAAEIKQRGGKKTAASHRPPWQSACRHVAVDEREEPGNHEQREENVEESEESDPRRMTGRHPYTQVGESG